jgi:hypothetical protein
MVALVVVGLALQQRNQDVARLLEVELVQPPMFRAKSVEPCALGRLDQRASFSGDTRTAVSFCKMIRNPICIMY